MQYLNFVSEADGTQTLYAGPVSNKDAAYLLQIAPYLRPLEDEAYMMGPAVVLHTFAKYSYVLDGNDVYWCIEWDPGLLVVKFSPEHDLAWVSLRSPVPNFGGRTPLPEDGDPDEYEDEDNPQYNLIFIPWDAQFDQTDREWRSFLPADTELQARFERALSHANALATVMESRYSADREQWIQRCKQNLKLWSGNGIRLKHSG